MAGPTVASALSYGGLVHQLSLVLLVATVLTNRVSRIRAMLAAAAIAGLAYTMIWAPDPAIACWWAVLLLAMLAMLARRFVRNRRVRFTPEEEAMVSSLFANLPRAKARHLLDQGFWLSGRAGDVLTREDEAVSHLFYLSAGEATVTSHGRQVGLCRAGDLIGEVTVLSGDQASATVTLSGPARFWCAPANVLRPYLDAHDDVRHAIEQSFTAALKTKLRASNERIAAASGMAAA